MTNNVYSYNNISYNTKRQTPGKAVVIRSYSCGEQFCEGNTPEATCQPSSIENADGYCKAIPNLNFISEKKLFNVQ